ncbi:MAG: radical SAM protein [Ruminococcus sp.]|nr:radical SAM protein [Ruminococcus sp.]
MKHSNISIFIPHLGCPHACSFCNQNTISGQQKAPTPDEVREILSQALNEVKDRKNTEIAFFGGSFTAIDRDYMTALLEVANEFLGENGFSGIRISTRPDFIDSEVLSLLKSYHVTAIELGAQSMCDDVLLANERGHTSSDVKNASRLVSDFGFELGLQMMTGLYKSAPENDLYTAYEIIKLHPKTVRIYPVAVLKNTKLHTLYTSGEYKLITFDEMVDECSKMLIMFKSANIEVIRCGLHSSEDVKNNLVAGFYHPAFKELCEGRIYRNEINRLIANFDKNHFEFLVNDRCISKAKGQNKENLRYFEQKGIAIKLIPDRNTKIYELKLLDTSTKGAGL